MNKLKMFVAIGIVIAGIAAAATPVHAAEQCKVNRLTDEVSFLDLKNKGMVQDGNTMNAKVVVSGDADCQKTVSIATWKWYNENGTPLESQVLYKTATQTFGVGTHVISVALPDCRWQADLVEGQRPTAADGTAHYKLAGEPSETMDALLDFSFGYTQPVCKDEAQKPSTQTPSTPIAAPTSTITRLPSTGAGNVTATTLALSGATAIGYSLIRSRKLKKQ